MVLHSRCLLRERNQERACVSVATYPAYELMKVRVSVTIGKGLSRCALVKEAGLDRGDGLSVARPGWGAFPFGGSVLWVLQHSHFIFPWKQTFCP